MTREEAKKAADVMLAYADGEKIEQRFGEQWKEVETPRFDWSFDDYRIKPQPTYRPFKGAKECWNEMQKHQPFGWMKDKGNEEYELLCLVDDGERAYQKLFQQFTFVDGEPFGIKTEDGE